MNNKKTEEWRNIIIKHYSKPLNIQKKISSSYKKIIKNSNFCVDNFEIGIIVKDNFIKDLVFNGIGCAISVSSIDIIIEEIKNLKIIDAINKINNFLNMLNSNNFNNDLIANLIVFSNVNSQPNRIKCASIGAIGILKLLNEELNNNAK